MSLLAELKQRKLVQWAFAYVAAAFALLQGIDIVAQRFAWPDAIERGLIIAACVGFFVALLLAWYHGERGAQKFSGAELLLLALVLEIGGGLLWKFSASPPAPVVASASTPTSKSDSAANVVSGTAIPSKSIAVLPFENLSEEKANGYFASGIQDQILTGLSRIGDLKVISRTSTQKYASRPDNLSQIAKELGVAHILEGSVQKAGNRVRINVQLIKAASDSHLWAQTYDRTLEDVFAVESEVAQKIAESLAANLSRGEREAVTHKPTTIPAAYDAYLRARAFNAAVAQTRQQQDAVLDGYRDAVRLDPNFALAWAELARESFRTGWEGLDPSGGLQAEGERALARATDLAPDSPQTAIARGVYMYYVQLDFSGALAIMNALKAKLPNDADLWAWAGYLSRRLGQFQESIADFEHAHALSPNDGNIAYHLAVSVISAGDCRRGVPDLDAALVLAPDNTHAVAMKMQCAWADGDLPRAAAYLQTADARLPVVQGLHGVQLLMRRDYAAAAKALQRASDGNDDTLIDAFLGGYLPARIEFQLQLALAQQRGGETARAQATYRQVQAEANKALADKPGSRYVETGWHCALGLALAGLGEREAAAAQGRIALSLVPESADHLEGPVWTWYDARILALSGNAADAVPVLRHLLRTPASLISAENLRNEPFWDAIRDDPRFQALIGRKGSSGGKP